MDRHRGWVSGWMGGWMDRRAEQRERRKHAGWREENENRNPKLPPACASPLTQPNCRRPLAGRFPSSVRPSPRIHLWSGIYYYYDIDSALLHLFWSIHPLCCVYSVCPHDPSRISAPIPPVVNAGVPPLPLPLGHQRRRADHRRSILLRPASQVWPPSVARPPALTKVADMPANLHGGSLSHRVWHDR